MALPKVGTILNVGGARAVVIGIAGTVNRGTMPVRRGVDIVSHHTGGTITGVHVQFLDTGELATVDRRSAEAAVR